MPNSFQENNTTNTFFGHWLLQFIKSHWTKSEITMSASPLQSSPIVKKSLDIYLDNKNRRNYLKWGFINAMILSVLMYDIKNKCPFSYSNWYYVEYVTAGLLAFSVLYYFTKFLFIWLTFEPIKGTQAQQKLLHFEDGGKYQFQSDSEVHSIKGWNLNCFSDSSFIVQHPEKIDSQAPKASPLDTSAIISWHSSFNDGELMFFFEWTQKSFLYWFVHWFSAGNRSTSNSMWGFNRSPAHQQSFNNSQNPNYSWSRVQNNLQNSFGNNTSPNHSNNNSFNSPYKTYTKDEIITDEHGLQKYLR